MAFISRDYNHLDAPEEGFYKHKVNFKCHLRHLLVFLSSQKQALANINLGGGDRVQLKSIWNTSKSEMRNDSL